MTTKKTNKKTTHKRDMLGRFIKGNHVSSEFKKGNKPWNYGLTKETNEIVRSISEDEDRKRKIGKASIKRNSVKNAKRGWDEWYERDPIGVREHMNTIGRTQGGKHVTDLELKVRKYLSLLQINYFTNVYSIKGSPDIVIPNNTNGHPICIFIDGCYWHGCTTCFDWFSENYETAETTIEVRHRDQLINNELSTQGFIVNRIWGHDINNNKYKEIINEILSNNNINIGE